jgi:dipeptidyl aminopeptidase/acylaminoacyl peptidase
MFRKLLWGFALCIAVSAASADTAAPASPGIIPVETFFTYAKVSAAKISPDGKYLAMAVANDKTGLEKNVLLILGTDDMKPKANFWLKGEQSILNFWWANDTRVVVATATQTGSLDRPQPDGDLYAINVDGTQKKQLMPYMPNTEAGHMHTSVSSNVYYGGLVYLSPDNDPKHVLIQGFVDEGSRYLQKPKAFRLDIYTGEIRQVAEGSEANGELLADGDGNVRLTWGQDQNGRAVAYYRADPGSDWKDMSALLFQGEDPAQSQSHPFSFTADNKRFYWLGRSKDSTLGLYLIDPEKMTREPIYEDPQFDITDVVGGFSTGNDAPTVAAVDTMPGLPAVHVVDGDDPKVEYLGQLYDAFPGQQVLITSGTRDHSRLVVATYSDKSPPDFYLYDTKSSQVRLLFAAKPEIDPAKMATMLPINVTARDGMVLHGYLTLPPGGSGKNLPLIVNPHGGPHGPRDEWGFNPEVQLFANRGYAVLQLNFRGSGGYGLRYQQAGYRHWSTTMQDDLADGIAWTVKQGYVDPKRVCIYGASYGGYAAFENPIRYPDLYKCAVGYVGAYDLTILGEHGDISHFAGGSHAIDIFLGTDMEERKRESPAYNADKLNIPLLIAYGGADVRVVPEHAENMMAALKKAGKSYEGPIYYPNEAHGFTKQEHNFDLYTRMLAFFDKYIGPGTAKSAPATK